MWAFRIVFAALVFWSAAAASAQSIVATEYGTQGTELSIGTGAATSASTTGAMVAAMAKWQITQWVGIEGRGAWFDRGTDATAFGADVSGVVNLVSRRVVTPFVGAGFGMYRASFASSSAPMSDFYRSRLTPQPFGDTQVFTDPAMRLTAGVDLIGHERQQHWSVRPEVSLLVVFASGQSETVLGGTVSVGYWFRGSARGNSVKTPVR